MKSQNDICPFEKHSLHGWDDEKIYYWMEHEGDVCVSYIPELMDKLEEMCRTFLEKKKDTRLD